MNQPLLKTLKQARDALAVDNLSMAGACLGTAIEQLEKAEPLVWVKYEVGCMPKFVPFIYGMVTFHEPSYGFMKYEPLYAHPAAPGEKK